MTRYDRIGRGYTRTRQPDPRLAAAIHAALGAAETVVNVGAGTGSYEPADRDVTAVEPSAVMLAQRPPGAAPAVQAFAEALPFADAAFDAAMTVISDHHWTDRAAGLRELRRVARRVVLVNADPAESDRFWLTADYLPEYSALVPDRYRVRGAWVAELEALLGPATIDPLPVPHDCADGFYSAFWRRPGAYLDDAVRAGISVFQRLDATAAIDRLRADLDSGAWRDRHADLLRRSELDVGLRLVVADESKGLSL